MLDLIIALATWGIFAAMLLMLGRLGIESVVEEQEMQDGIRHQRCAHDTAHHLAAYCVHP